jgi:hypothetical protein
VWLNEELSRYGAQKVAVQFGAFARRHDIEASPRHAPTLHVLRAWGLKWIGENTFELD